MSNREVNNRTYIIRPLILIFILVFFSFSLKAQVKVYEEPLTLPTYGLMDAESMPDWRNYRYPYPMYDRLTNKRGERTYKALYVENEYVKALVLPELGGRLHGAEDKTNGYQFLYNQKVIKPALIGLTGAWISGGVEWNFPIGHRPSGFRDVDWTLQVNADSSKTAWVGETDRLTGMRWSVGITVHPGRNWIETKVRLYNCTPYVQPFQYWATSAVRATWNYQAVIPGEIMTGHGKKEFMHWPVSEGVDVSYWKNNPAAGSKFAVDSRADYFGGYSPEEDAGMVHVADHAIVRGKKLWTWGTAPSGRIWEKILTDGDLPYYEPQAGAYSDNQPSIFWIKPGDTKIFSHFWFPVRDIGVYDYANLEGALNLDLNQDTVVFGWSPTGENKDAKISITRNGKEIYAKTADAGPAHPYLGKVTLNGQATLYDLRMNVLSSGGDTLLSYSHPRPLNPPFPEPEPDPLAPAKINSQDLLFVTGDHINKYGDPERAKNYYREALDRDPGDVRCNTAMGELALKEGLTNEAIKYFETALNRNETYFRAFYFKGLAEAWAGKYDEAVYSLERSSYDLAWYAPAHFELAQLCLRLDRPDKALEHIDRSIRGNGYNTEAYDVKSLVLLRQGRLKDALALLSKNQDTDPLGFFAPAVRMFIHRDTDPDKAKEEEAELLRLTRRDNENHIDLAIRFARSGFFNEAAEILDMIASGPGNDELTPLVLYYESYYSHLAGRDKEAANLCVRASQINPAYCFPNRPESFDVLHYAASSHPDDGLAHYLLGDLLRSRDRIKEAVAEWEKSVILTPENAVAWRNLGQAYRFRDEPAKAVSAYNSALKADPGAGKVIVELADLYMNMKIPLKEQIAFLEKRIGIVSQYNQAITQLIRLYVSAGRYKDAISWLQKNHFNSWEGQYGIHQFWIESNLAQGDLEFNSKHYRKALDYYHAALTYPENLEVAEQPNTVHARKNFKIGMTLRALGEKEAADSCFRLVTAANVPAGNANQFYRARSFEELGEKEKAADIFRKLLNASAKGKIQAGDEEDATGLNDRMRIAEAARMYTHSLALEGLGKDEEAAILRKEATDLEPLAVLYAFRAVRSGE